MIVRDPAAAEPSHAHCLLWHGTVLQRRDHGQSWDTQVFDETAAQAFCPLELLPGEAYTDAWYRQRLPEGKRLTDTAAAEAFATGLSHYSAQFGCRGRDGVERWFSEQVHIEPLPGDHGRLDPEAIQGWRVVGVAVDITEHKRAEEAVTETARRQRAFLHDMLASVTEGKLRLCDTSADLPPRLSPVGPPLPLSMTTGLRELRRRAQEAAMAQGFPADRRHDLVTAVSEAAMNAVVHAGGGQGWVCSDGCETVQVRVEDRGPGIAVEDLPRATLSRGYTTAGTLGHGLKMMLQTADRMWLLTGPAGTVVVLEQDRHEPRPSWL